MIPIFQISKISTSSIAICKPWFNLYNKQLAQSSLSMHLVFINLSLTTKKKKAPVIAHFLTHAKY